MKRKYQWILFAALSSVLVLAGLSLSAAQAQTTPTQTPGSTVSPQSPTVRATASVPADDSDNLASSRTLSVTGTGRASVQPDVAVLRLGVRTDQDTAVASLAENTQSVEAVLEALRDAGVDARDLQTQSIQLYPRYEEQTGGTPGAPTLSGYTAVNTVQVRVRDLLRTGEILDEAVQAGANTVESITFEISDPTQAEQAARRAAVADARRKGEELAALVGAELGPVVSISEGSAGSIPVAQGGSFDRLEAAVPVEPGSQDVILYVQVTWSLSGVIPTTGGNGTATSTPPAATRTPTAVAGTPGATTEPLTTATPEAGTPVSGTPAGGTPGSLGAATGQPAQPAAEAARQDLANTLRLSVDEIEIVSIQAMEWSDSCLGLGRANESCLQVITPGWLILFEASSKTYEAHTNNDGSILRWKES